MMSFQRKTGPLTVWHKYFHGDPSWRDAFRLTVYYQADPDKKPFGFISKPFHTIENDLTLPSEEIFANFTSTVRNEVRRSEREGVRFEFMHDLREFHRFHNSFAAAKKTYRADLQLIEAYRDHLVVTCAKHEQTILAAHAYLYDAEGKKVRLLFSSSVRLTANMNMNFIGRANKFLHFKDMLHFKDLGCTIYDFGGIAVGTQDKQRRGINDFKQSFGGKIVASAEYQSWLYWWSAKLFYRLHAIRSRLSRTDREQEAQAPPETHPISQGCDLTSRQASE
jgi:lipid II:glycine glycyltransferase (peptidoglycan interpeptide bridge formation enzyme)